VAGRRAIVDGPVTTTIHPPLSLRADVVGHAAKRGLIPRTPTGERLLTDLETWLTAEYADTIRSTRRRTLDDGATELAIALHPAAPDVRLTADDTGRVTASAETVMAGPGYHRFVGRVIERAGLEHAIAWGQSPDEAELVPDGGLTFADRQAVERTYLGWLGETATGTSTSGCRQARATGSTAPSRPPSARATPPGSMPPSPIRASRSTSRRGGRTRRTAGTSSTAPYA
jgi:hypothetical protein